MKKQVNANKVGRNILNVATAVGNLAAVFQSYAHTMEQRANTKKSVKEDRRLKGALKHIAKYGKNTALHTFKVPSRSRFKEHEVKQMLVGPWTCSCEDNTYRHNECYHIRKAMNDPKNALDIAYGQGAIEAHRRLTTIANDALDTKRYTVMTPGGVVSCVMEGYPNGATLKQANEFISLTSRPGYTVVPFVPEGSKVEPVSKYRLEMDLRSYSIEPHEPKWEASSSYEGTYTKEEASKIIKENKNGIKYRMVPV